MPPVATQPVVVTLERAWHDLMVTLAIRNPAKVKEAKIVLRVIDSQMRGR
jgi:hypothetical protein